MTSASLITVTLRSVDLGPDDDGRRRLRSLAAADLLEHRLEDGVGGPRAAVLADQAGVPGRERAAGVPVVEVDALDARAHPDEVVEDVARHLGGVADALLELGLAGRVL